MRKKTEEIMRMKKCKEDRIYEEEEGRDNAHEKTERGPNL